MNVATQVKQQTAKAPTPRSNRMTLDAIKTGKVEAPYRITIMGTDGIGKSTFAASAPDTVFLGPELGTNHLNVARFPVPESFDDIRDAIHTLTSNRGSFKTLAVDSVDWLEPLIWTHVCKAAGVTSIEEVGGGYGKGYTAAMDTWRILLADLERLQRDQQMHIILVAHSFIKLFRNPEGDDFERYVLKLNDKAAALIREWCDGVYFANYETFAVKDKAKRIRGVSTGVRLMHTQRTAAFDAKDRYGLPEQLPLDWEEFDAAARAGKVAEPATLRAEIERKAEGLEEEMRKKALSAIGRAGDDTAKLSQLNNWCNSKLAEREQKEVK